MSDNNKEQEQSKTSIILAGIASFGLLVCFFSTLIWFSLNKLLSEIDVNLVVSYPAVFCGFLLLSVIFYIPMFVFISFAVAEYTTINKIMLLLVFDGIKKVQNNQVVNTTELIDEFLKKYYYAPEEEKETDSKQK